MPKENNLSQDELKLMLNVIYQTPLSYKLIEIKSGVYLTKEMESLINKLESLITDKSEATPKA